jgi:N-glycosylase/DNA lyase
LEYTLTVTDDPFDLDYTLESGQTFRWERRGEWWVGVVSSGVLKVKQDGDALYCMASDSALDSNFLRRYFRLGEDTKGALTSIMKDPAITEAVQKFYGLNLIRQDPWECLVSFVLATNANIPRISKMVSNLCSNFGQELSFEGLEYHLFPTQEVLADSTTRELERCGLGYRAPFVKKVAKAVYDQDVQLTELLMLDYLPAKELLMKELLGKKVLKGVGPKVADCVLLFSCDKNEAFPIDVWVARIISKIYPALLGPKLTKSFSGEGGLSQSAYDQAGDIMRGYFGKNAGLAQQYLFTYARASEAEAT